MIFLTKNLYGQVKNFLQYGYVEDDRDRQLVKEWEEMYGVTDENFDEMKNEE